ncbi:hypothetical protein GW932_02150 [archaeon]|nr:hypothetical protein [archaeon]
MNLNEIWQYFFGKRESNFERYKKISIFPREPTIKDPYVGRLSSLGALYKKIYGVEYISNPIELNKGLEKEVKK